MFGRIAPTYDLLNRCLTLGLDRRWRRKLAARARTATGGSGLALDLCCGTGDVTFELENQGLASVGIDFTPELLECARLKGEKRGQPLKLLRADALALPSPAARASAVTIAFGLRNLADRRAGLREMRRVLEPGGSVLVLELSTPRGLLGWVYGLYFGRVLPVLGRLVSKDPSAYLYLRDTVLAWPRPEQLLAELHEEGYEDGGFDRMAFGVVALHWARVPRGSQVSEDRSGERESNL